MKLHVSQPGALRIEGIVRTLTTLLPSPPHQPNISSVARSVAHCIQDAIAIVPVYQSLAGPFLTELQWFLDGLKEGGHTTDNVATLLGIATTFPGWCCLAKLDSLGYPSLMVSQLVGLELCIALASGKAVRPSTIVLANRALRESGGFLGNDTRINAEEVPKGLARLTKFAMALAPCVKAGIDSPRYVALHNLLLSSIASSLSSLRGQERKAAGADFALSTHDARIAIKRLSDASEHSDSEALALQIAFCLGLPWHIAKLVPFATTGRPSGALAWIDVRMGCSFVDLQPVIPELPTKGADLHAQSTLLLERPLPLNVASQLAEAVAANSNLKTLGDLVTSTKAGKSKLSRYGLHHSASVARLISSAGPIALNQCRRRDLAAFATLSLELINKSDLHYIASKAEDIWAVCASLFEVVGLGAAVPRPTHDNSPRVGSKLCPSSQWIEDVFQEAQTAVAQTRCGRRYSLLSLVRHHNAYAGYVGLMLQLGLGGRDRRTFNFSAEMVCSENSFALVIEHKLSKTMGQTPLPLPAVVAEQISLWKAHLIALMRRLAKLKANGTNKASIWISQILEDQNVPLIFILAPDGSPLPMGKEHWRQGKAADLNADFGRHLVPDALTESGLSFCDAQDWLRHDTNGISHHIVSSEHVKYLYLQRTATVLNNVLLALKIRPVAGLTKGAT